MQPQGPRRRVRTGCLVCRQRRRKCDEAKPTCNNCKAKGAACHYSIDRTFIPTRITRHERSQLVGAATPKSYGTIQFVVSAISGDPSATDQCAEHYASATSRTPTHVSEEFNTPSSELNLASPESHITNSGNGHAASKPLRVQGLRSDPGPSIAVPSIGDSAATVATLPVSKANHQPIPFSKGIVDEYRANLFLSPGDEEISLLRHFCYHLCSWLTFGDAKSSFGLNFLTLANSHKPLMDTVLALSAKHCGLTIRQEDARYFAKAASYRHLADKHLQTEGDRVKQIGRILLVVYDLLSSTATQWRFLIEQHKDIYEVIATNQEDEVVESVVWTVLKFDIAASMMGKHTPLAPLDLLRATAEQSPFRTPKKYACQMMLLCLAQSLGLLYGDRSSSPTRNGAPFLFGPTPTQPQLSGFWSEWKSLWNQCQDWYCNRPTNMQPILTIRSKRGGEGGSDDAASFPTVLYTDSLALITNVVYHFASFLLSSQKPRLSKALAHPSHLTSALWHASYLAGAVNSNNFPEAWDPIVTVSLLLVSRQMTHDSQQSILMEQLEKIRARVGISLG